MSGRRQGQIIPRGEGTFLLRVYLYEDEKGKRHYRNETVHGTISQAKRALASMQVKANGGTLLKRSKDTVRDYIEWWLDDIHATRVRESTHRTVRYRLTHYALPVIGNVLLERLDKATVQALYSSLTQQGLASRMVRHVHAALHAALEDAVDLGKLPSNPCHKRKLPTLEKKSRTTLSPEQVHLLLESTKGQYLHALWHVLFLAGLRPAEALALRWSDVDGSYLHVRQAWQRGLDNVWKLAAPKTEPRRVPIMEDTVVALKEHQRRTGTVGDALVFQGKDGGRFQMQRANRKLNRLLVDLSLPKLRLYDTRHTHATNLHDNGEDLLTISRRLGHASTAVTASTYVHLSAKTQRDAVLRLSDRMKEAANG